MKNLKDIAALVKERAEKRLDSELAELQGFDSPLFIQQLKAERLPEFIEEEMENLFEKIDSIELIKSMDADRNKLLNCMIEVMAMQLPPGALDSIEQCVDSLENKTPKDFNIKIA